MGGIMQFLETTIELEEISSSNGLGRFLTENTNTCKENHGECITNVSKIIEKVDIFTIREKENVTS